MLGTTQSSSQIVDTLRDDEIQALLQFSSAPAFGQPRSFYTTHPYQRPSRPQDIDPAQLATPLASDGLASPEHLLAQRLLLNIYEQDLVFLPKPPQRLDMKAFKGFYDPANMALGKQVRPLLEHYTYGWLKNEVHINGPWCEESFIAHTDKVLEDVGQGPSRLHEVLTGSRDPQRAARFFLIQCAGDFLSEASAMARNVLGNAGPHTSELFKILIDEYGYGIDKKKHSSIFETLLDQAGLSSQVHHYWQFYTASSLSLTNYFHYVSANHGEFFRYIGAMYYTEASLALTTGHQSRALKDIFGDSVSTEYFDEHQHIDVHHGRMALERLIIPLIRQYGPQVIPDLIRGFEEFRLLQDLADEELYAHIKWHDELDACRARASMLHGSKPADARFTEPLGEVSVLHCHANTELFWVESGELDFVVSPQLALKLGAGEGVIIPKGMLHGTHVTSPSCTYTVTAL
ncbi:MULTISPECIES: iron-containing redox enzyme family protein [unclassified Pseudomonas]|uniref:iron-containing redox enzyme family protein n=1 Tax=unclassified Pseudomonas TaxID=196821 RepID=UPI000302C3F2|nr:iron-containing redox enzyme family protein [Pseudomonas sp. M47T1]